MTLSVGPELQEHQKVRTSTSGTDSPLSEQAFNQGVQDDPGASDRSVINLGLLLNPSDLPSPRCNSGVGGQENHNSEFPTRILRSLPPLPSSGSEAGPKSAAHDPRQVPSSRSCNKLTTASTSEAASSPSGSGPPSPIVLWRTCLALRRCAAQTRGACSPGMERTSSCTLPTDTAQASISLLERRKYRVYAREDFCGVTPQTAAFAGNSGKICPGYRLATVWLLPGNAWLQTPIAELPSGSCAGDGSM